MERKLWNIILYPLKLQHEMLENFLILWIVGVFYGFY
jgi:hypothetical protein